MASSPSPEEYAQQASCFCANLNGLVDRDTSRLFRGNRARVYRGTLKREGSGASGVIQVALKTVWFAPEGDGSVEVCTTITFVTCWLTSFLNLIAVCPPGGSCLVQALSSQHRKAFRVCHRI